VVPPPLGLLNSHIQGIQSTCSLTWPDPHVSSESLRLHRAYRTSHQSSFSHNWNNSHFGQVVTFVSIPHSIPYIIQFSVPHSVFYKQLCQRNAYVSLVVMVTWTLNAHFICRYAFTIIANVLVFSLFWILLEKVNPNAIIGDLQPDDKEIFWVRIYAGKIEYQLPVSPVPSWLSF